MTFSRLRSSFVPARRLNAWLMAFGSIITLALPVGVSAAACVGAPDGFTTSCEASCSGSMKLAGNYYTIDPKFLNASCGGGNTCCLQTGNPACDAEARSAGYVSGACKAAPGTGDTVSKQPASTCDTGKCYYSQSPQPAPKPATPPKTGATPAASKPGSPTTLPDPLGGVNFPQLIGNIIRTFSGIAGAIALLMFVWGGITWILSGGEASKVKNAQKTLINATIGMILIFGAYAFSAAIVQAILANPVATPDQTVTTQ